jgi:electron transfer flavoprotein beta subunit
LHVVVITKSTPDTEATITVNGDSLDWGDKLVVNPWDEYAITEAILMKGEHNAKVTIITVGTEEHVEALKHGLAIGCDQAIRLWDPAMAGYDSLVYAKVVAAAITKLGDVDLIIFGKELSDLATDQHIFQVARKLGFNMLGSVAKVDAVDFGAKTIKVQRASEQGTQAITSKLPAVISVLKDINEPKYPTFIGIRKAAKADMPVWDYGTLGLSASDMTPQASVTGYRELPKREGEVELIEGDAATAAAALVDKLLEDKVL